jgi:hypothetical protein
MLQSEEKAVPRVVEMLEVEELEEVDILAGSVDRGEPAVAEVVLVAVWVALPVVDSPWLLSSPIPPPCSQQRHQAIV